MKSRVLTKVSEVNKQVDSFIDEQVKVLEEHRAHLKHKATTQGQVKVKQLDSQADDLSSLGPVEKWHLFHRSGHSRWR